MLHDSAGQRWVRVFYPSPKAAARLLCFPHAGGAASWFGPMARALAPTVEVAAVQYPGRQDRFREPCLSSVQELADAPVGSVLASDDRPVGLFGHSMGASVAFEAAVRLESSGTAPVAVFVSGRRAPSRIRHETLHQLDDGTLVARIRELGGADAQHLADTELLSLALPALRADLRAAETYRWQGGGPLRSPLHVHVGVDDPQVTEQEARAWALHTSGDCTITRYPGGHFYLDACRDQLVRRLTHELAI